MALFSEEVAKLFPPLHSQDTIPDAKLRAYARLTCEPIGVTWFLLEMHENKDFFSAYLVDRDTERFGYFSCSYLLAYLEGHLEEEEPIHTDDSFAPQLLTLAVAEERRIRAQRGEKRPKTPALAQHRAYFYATKYDTPSISKVVYTAVRDIVFQEQSPTNISVFNVQPGFGLLHWTVVVIGDRPAEHVHKRIMETLQGGTMTLIPYDLLMHLFARKLEENQKGGWQEHNRTVVVKRKTKQKQKKRKSNRKKGK